MNRTDKERDAPRYLTAEEAAYELRLSTVTVRRQLRDGLIPAAKVGRRWLISRETLDALTTPERAA